MGKSNNTKFVFPLTSLQIGDLQSYLSDLSLFVALESNRLYILVDNRPWLRDFGSRTAHLWQLMVTKSRLSPFANTKAQRGRKEGKAVCSESNLSKSKKIERWFSLIDAATLSRKRGLVPVKNLRNSLFLSNELHRTLYGFIVFEVSWTNVRGINYLNELQTDTSLALESKIMRRWEFDSIEQAASCISLWFSGTLSEQLHMKEYLESAIGEIFYDAKENFSRIISIDDEDNICNDSLGGEDISLCCPGGSSSVNHGTMEDRASDPHTPPPTGPYKRRRVTKSISTGVEVDFYSEEIQGEIEDWLDDSETYTSDCENTVEPKQYRDVLILFKFNDPDLPFKLRDIVISDLRLLTLLEAGLPSWVLFLQSYPGFCHLYRPWMCPLARALYVLISIVTVLIGFYDLYKNVPVLKATASRLCGPLFDWIETWEMVSRIKYLGTMLFLHNFQKAVTWILMVTRTTRSFFSIFTQPLVEPLTEILGILLPIWNVLMEVVESFCSIVWFVSGSFCKMVIDLIELTLWPLWLIVSMIWSIATTILYPIFWILWEVLYTPIRMVLAIASFIALICAWISELIGDIWRSVSGIFQLASASEATMRTYEVSIWRSLWNDLFSQVFRALRSILNGFVAFFTACNRHRLSIYNHIQDFIQRIFGRAQRSQPSGYRHNGPTRRTQSLAEVNSKIHIS
ncbi:hypothetical protein P3X46_012128 [Hevea brasiliensis]|uniref:Uncharacterized protein n=1 Tax=Hevea brasiliensis TaxID=3981 RepID=A0ABQ9MD47_HEVBR|nr:uncharacterized protein LOC110642543 isoform X2 [Hevea brasiliensis]XP_021650327.2 uncharacterized protein LOC110642543 isoform X2 [Hevea brasiliensis]KAJ9176857.1 hypothetical protein P3X46_012128 [Hevea brasiliensis]KAJ9176858.1 hypothetical protein P3X46_012128 [Hevea brasiliensis]